MNPTLRTLLDALHAVTSNQFDAFLNNDVPAWNLLQAERSRLDSAISSLCLQEAARA
jgi:hypothetical protein